MYLLVLAVCVFSCVQTQYHDYHDPEFVFPGESNHKELIRPMDRAKSLDNDKNMQIPIDFLQKLNEAEDLDDIVNNYVEGDDLKDIIGFQLGNRFAGGSERAGVTMAKAAKCMPTLQTVELKNANESDILYLPSCTRVNRCGGCCTHSLLSCQPSQTETLNVQVLATQYTGGAKLQLKGKEIIVVEQHVKCRCDCRVKEKDCSVFQTYKKDECRCECKNIDERKKCHKSMNIKLWDPELCKCLCRETKECTTGSVYDQNKCACIPVPLRRRFAELNSSRERSFSDAERYNVDTLSVLHCFFADNNLPMTGTE